MSDLQKEAATVKSMASNYQKIATIFNELPARFRLLDAFRLAGIKDGIGTRSAVSAVLSRDFKCINVGSGLNRVWKKPQ